MKKNKKINLILASLMIITLQSNTADKQQLHIEETQPSTINDDESKIAQLQQQLTDTTNKAADSITKEIIEKCNILKKKS